MSSLQGAPEVLPGHLNGEVFVTPEEHFRYYAGKGLGHVRLEGSWERMQPRLYGKLGEGLLDHYGDAENPWRNPVNLVRHYLDLAEKYHLKVVLDLAHNYGSRYVGYDGGWGNKRKGELGSEEVPIGAWVDYQVKVVREFGGHPAVAGVELMNEPHDLAMGTEGWAKGCQEAIDAIRRENKSVVVFVDGYGWASAEYWVERNPTLHRLRDPADRLMFTAHQYLDEGSAGIYAGGEAIEPKSGGADLGVRRIGPFVGWLAAHGLEGHGSLGEFGVPDTAAWAERARRMMVAAAGAGLMLTAHEDVPYAEDPYVMNLYPGKGGEDRYVIRLMESLRKKGDGNDQIRMTETQGNLKGGK